MLCLQPSFLMLGYKLHFIPKLLVGIEIKEEGGYQTIFQFWSATGPYGRTVHGHNYVKFYFKCFSVKYGK